MNDDYVKFIRYGQHFIEKNGSGVLAFINPHGFLDNPTFRGMRWNLLTAFDRIYTIDLHGNSKKKETAPDGGPNENVFDIQQGVSINLFIKTGKKKAKELGKLLHFDLFGKRDAKYEFLLRSSLDTIVFRNLKPEKPFYFFVPKNTKGLNEYNQGFRIDELFMVSVTGIVTARDALVIDFDKQSLIKRMEDFSDVNQSDDIVRNKYFGNKKSGKYLAGDSRGWKMVEARKKIRTFNHNSIIQKVAYRIFDDRFIYYHNAMVDWGREKYMSNFINRNNLGLDLCRQTVTNEYSHIFITNKIVDDSFVSNKSRERGYVYPLYIYTNNNGQQAIGQTIERTPNLNTEIIDKITVDLIISFVDEKTDIESSFAPIDILDYIYAVLHSPTYREKYKEFLKIDFPRVPYPKDMETFWQLVKLGDELRQIHLLESPTVEKFITQYPIDGDNVVIKPEYKSGRVFINDTQYFDNVPEVAWDFYIGGYQPAQKWLKDRKGRKLEFDDIRHYQKIIVALTETNRIMKEIDKIAF